MSAQALEIKYKCKHPSCIVNCREGVVEIGEELYNELSQAYEEDGLFRSPKGFCRMGFAQPLKAEEVKRLSEEDQSSLGASSDSELDRDNPVAILKAEHQEVLRILDSMEGQLKKRELEKLWASISELEYRLDKHSMNKEEKVLFPILKDLMPLGEGLVGIVQEDHLEVLNLLFSFRDALADGDIFDGIINSVVTNLQSHIRKEDEEFFELVEKTLDPESRAKVLEGMRKIDETYPEFKVPDRHEHAAKARESREKRKEIDEQILAVKDLVNVNSDGGCCHG